MTNIDEPARFWPTDDGKYQPGNSVAVTFASELSKMRLDDKDLLYIKKRGFRCTLMNGEEINVGVVA